MCHFNALTFLFLNQILTCLPIRFLDLIFYDKNARLKSIGSKKYVLRLDRVALFFWLSFIVAYFSKLGYSVIACYATFIV